MISLNKIQKSYEKIKKAILKNKPGELERLLAQGIDPNRMFENDYDDCSPVFLAARLGRVECLEVLIRHGADVHFCFKTGMSTLMAAVLSPHPDEQRAVSAEDRTACVEKLLDQGVNIHQRDSRKNTAIHYAVQAGNLKAIDLLVSVGASLYAMGDRGNALHLAIKEGNCVVARHLLALGMDASVEDRYGQHAVALAISKDRAMLETVLIAGHRLGIEVPDAMGLPPLHSAVNEHRPEMVDLLLAQGANVNQRTDKSHGGETALHIACRSPVQPDTIAILLAAGADCHAISRSGQNPLHVLFASSNFSDATAENEKRSLLLLLRSGADPYAVPPQSNGIKNAAPIDFIPKREKRYAVIRALIDKYMLEQRYVSSEAGDEELDNNLLSI